MFFWKKPPSQPGAGILGATFGDALGAPHEGKPGPLNIQSWESGNPTDDTILVAATCDAILQNPENPNYKESYQFWASLYPKIGFGPQFYLWCNSTTPTAYRSSGNGAALRAIPIGYAFSTLEKTLSEAARATLVSHNLPAATLGAQASAMAIFLARNGESPKKIAKVCAKHFGCALLKEKDLIQPKMDARCESTIPLCLSMLALYGKNPEICIQRTICLGGDTDSHAALVGAIACEATGTQLQAKPSAHWLEAYHCIQEFQKHIVDAPKPEQGFTPQTLRKTRREAHLAQKGPIYQDPQNFDLEKAKHIASAIKYAQSQTLDGKGNPRFGAIYRCKENFIIKGILEKEDIEWFSPEDMNPNVHFD